jgi:hypothetical protein
VSGADVEVVTKLTLETVADQMLARIKDGLVDVKKGEDDAKDSGDGWLNSFIEKSHQMGFEIREMAERVYDFAKSFVDTAAEGNAADTAIAGLISTAQGRDWDSAFDMASEYGDAMDVIAAKAGVAGDSVGEAFQTMLEIGGATEMGLTNAKNQVAQLAHLAGVLGKDAGGIAREFSMMGEGVLRTKGQLFQLLQSTGIFGDDIKKAGEQWTKLTDTQRANLLGRGLNDLTNQLEDAKPSFNQLKQSMVDMYETGKEKLGEPLMNALIPVLESVKAKLTSVMPAIEEFAEKIGPQIAKWVDEAYDTVQEAGEYVSDNWDSITTSVGDVFAGIQSAFSMMWEAVKFLVANKEVIVALLALNAAKNFAQSAVAVSGGGKAGGGMGSGLGESMGSLASSIGGLITNGVSPATAAFAGLSIVTAAGVHIWTMFNEAAEDFADTAKRGHEQRQKVADAGDVEWLKVILANKQRMLSVANERMEKSDHATTQTGYNLMDSGDYSQTKKLAEQYARDIVETQQMIDTAIATADAKAKAAADMKAAQQQVGHQQFINDSLRMISAYHEADTLHSAAAQTYADNLAVNITGQMIDGYNRAMASGNQAQAVYLANIFAGDSHLQAAFLESGQKIEGGLLGLANNISDSSSSFKANLEKIGGSFASDGKAKIEPPKVSLSGGGPVTINIKQDYRDQDPDRVAVVFQRDLEKAAYRRMQSQFTTPFGS